VKFGFIDAEKAHYAVRTLCRCLEVSRSGYDAWTHRPPSARAEATAELAAEITAIHRRSHERYGSPRVHIELQTRGRHVSRKRVARVMREHALRARRARRWTRTTTSDHALPVAENRLNREFTAAAPDQVWVTDITYIPTHDGWLYLAAIVDLFARRVVGWATSESLATALPLAALEQALHTRRPQPGLLHHSDRGSQYASAEYQRVLATRGIVCSMSRRGNCWDNAVAESFFATLKTELVPADGFPSRHAAQAEIALYIEDFYNAQRRHSYNAYLSPLEAELKHAVEPTAAYSP
jgi:putative transposase